MPIPKGQSINPITGHWNLDGSLYRIKKPSYYYFDANTIRIDASEQRPVTFNIANKFYTITANLDLVRNVGTASTVYYIYAVVQDNIVYLVQSTDAPSSGLEGYAYGDWSYVGAFSLNASAALEEFQATNGHYMANNNLQAQTVALGGARTALVYTAMPAHARMAWFRIQCGSAGAGANQTVIMSGTDSTDNSLSIKCPVNGQDHSEFGWVQILTSKTVWATPTAALAVQCDLLGWRESPEEFP